MKSSAKTPIDTNNCVSTTSAVFISTYRSDDGYTLGGVAIIRGKRDAIRSHVTLDSHMMSDELNVYHPLSMGFRKHDTIKHSGKEYVRGEVHTNTVEGVFSLLKRGIVGSFHHVSKGHLHRYCDEFEFRYNTRTALGYSDAQRAAALVIGAEGKRLTYKMPA